MIPMDTTTKIPPKSWLFYTKKPTPFSGLLEERFCPLRSATDCAGFFPAGDGFLDLK